jgi:D-amino peptidase
MKLYISADIEGVAGVVSRDQGGPKSFEYDKGRAWMTSEVCAACEGAFEAGVTQVVISDSHGNGQNLLLDELPDDVRVVRSWPRPLGMMEGIQEGGFDAAMLLGYHAGATNAAGNLAHTIFGLVIRCVRINGVIASEAYISAATAGDSGVPIVLISGDDSFIEESHEFLGKIESVITKRALGTLSANTIMPAKSCQLIREAAARALENVGEYRPFAIDPPIRLQVEFKHRLPAELLDYLPIVERQDAFTVEYVASDMSDASRFLSFVTEYAPTLV